MDATTALRLSAAAAAAPGIPCPTSEGLAVALPLVADSTGGTERSPEGSTAGGAGGADLPLVPTQLKMCSSSRLNCEDTK